MILDERTEFADNLALNSGAGPATFLIGDVVDLMGTLQPLQNRDVGSGHPIYFTVTVDQTVVGAGGSLAVELITDDNSAMATPNVLATVGPVAVGTNLTTGRLMGAISLPIEGVPYERYLGIRQNTIGAALTAGRISAFLVLDVAKWRPYKDADN